MSDQMPDKLLIDFNDNVVENDNNLSKSLNSEPPVSISFAGCGFLIFYYLGVTACLTQYKQINKKTIICSASSGTFVGVALCSDMTPDENVQTMLHLANKVRDKPLGLVQPSCDLNKFVYNRLNQVLPDDCHKRSSGRLFISVTRVSDGKNVLISQYDSKEDLIRAIQCSSFMPFISGMSPPKYKGVSYMDGALSNNAPKLTENTITVSPWVGEFDICPMADTSLPLQVMFYNKLISLSPLNLYRMSHIAIPPSWEVNAMLCQQGFNDTLRYLMRNNKIPCTGCLVIQSPFTTRLEDLEDKQRSDSGYDNNNNEDRLSHNSAINCNDCHKEVNDSIPESIVQAIEEDCHKVNQKLMNRLLRQPLIKLVLILFIPFLLVFEIIIALVFGILMNNCSSEWFKDMLNISKIMVRNGLIGREQKPTYLDF